MSEYSTDITEQALLENIKRQIRRYDKLKEFVILSLDLQNQIERAIEIKRYSGPQDIGKEWDQFQRRINDMRGACIRAETMRNLYANSYQKELPEETEEKIDEMIFESTNAQDDLARINSRRTKTLIEKTQANL